MVGFCMVVVETIINFAELSERFPGFHPHYGEQSMPKFGVIAGGGITVNSPTQNGRFIREPWQNLKSWPELVEST